ncbi:ABC transporter substrate-binding protein [Paracoccus sp. R86501]|uniref:ABC transporter substrate-binding protein n=1 Tax=Paracoccus sp. R86501 TaxID=3101711 RepID=UPI00366B6A42
MKLLTTTILAAGLLTGAAHAEDLRMSWWGGDARHAQTREALAVCGEKHDHDVAAEFTGWAGHQERITTQIAGRTEADIMQINWPWLPLFSPDGTGFADLRDHADTIDLSQWTDAQLAGGEMNGVLNGLPVAETGRVYFFNKTVFDAAGLPLPSTWDEVRAAAGKLGEGVTPFEAQGLNAIFLVSTTVTQMTGKDLIDPETTTVAWTPQELAAGIRFYLSLVEDGVIRSWQQVASEGNIELFEMRPWAEGRIAGTYEWDSAYAKYADPLGDQELVPVPMLQVEGAVNDGTYRKPSMLFAISARSQHPRAAAQIIDCLLNDADAIDILSDSRGIPASRTAAERLAAEGLIDANVVAAHDLVQQGQGPVPSPLSEHPKVRSIFGDYLEAVAYDQIGPEDAAAEMIDEIDRALRSFR